MRVVPSIVGDTEGINKKLMLSYLLYSGLFRYLVGRQTNSAQKIQEEEVVNNINEVNKRFELIK